MTQSRKMAFGRFDYAAFISFFSYASGSVVVPVVLVFLARDLGFSLEQGGLSAGGALHLGRTLTMVASMLVCGFLAGRWGKRRTLGWSVVLMGLAMGLCALAPSLRHIVSGLDDRRNGRRESLKAWPPPSFRTSTPVNPAGTSTSPMPSGPIGVLVTVLVRRGPALPGRLVAVHYWSHDDLCGERSLYLASASPKRTSISRAPGTYPLEDGLGPCRRDS